MNRSRIFSANDPLLKATVVCFIPDVCENNEPTWAADLKATFEVMRAQATTETCQVWGPGVGEQWLKNALAKLDDDRVPIVVVLLPGGRKAGAGVKCIEQLHTMNLVTEGPLVAALGTKCPRKDVLNILDASVDAIIPYSRRRDATWVRERLRNAVRGISLRDSLPFDLPWLTKSRGNGDFSVTGTPVDAEHLFEVAQSVCRNRMPKNAPAVHIQPYANWDELFSTTQKLRGAGPVLIHIHAPHGAECEGNTEDNGGAKSMDEEAGMGLVAVSFLAGLKIPTICVSKACEPKPDYWGVPWTYCVWYEYTCETDLIAQLYGWLVGQRDRGQ